MKNKGISLIVLIITIVVIIILATAIIVNIAETNIIGNANEAVVKQDIKTFQDELDLYIADKYTDTLGEFDISTINAYTEDEVIAIIPSIKNTKYKEYISIASGKIIIKSTMEEPQKTWAMEALNEEKYGIATVDNKVEGKNATINGENPTYYNPVIPVGFKAKETSSASWNVKDGKVEGWNDGLVIQDENGNEFVWVPVDEINVTYTKRFEEYPKLSNMTSVTDDVEAIPVANENEQIIKYGGFYVGRYEVGVPENQTIIDGTFGDGETSKSNVEGIPVSKPGATVWTCVSYNTMNTNFKKMYESSTSVKSGIVTGTQWDTIMKWLEKSYINVSSDSTSWGNYSNSSSPANVNGHNEKQVTGFSEYWKAKNIYDLAGNVWELTAEIFTYNRVMRGGQCINDGTHFTASYRNRSGNPSVETQEVYAFRMVLYVM